MLGRKVIYVRCISCSYNNVAKGIRLLDKKAIILVYTVRKIFMQERAFERYIPLRLIFYHICIYIDSKLGDVRWKKVAYPSSNLF